MTLVRTLNLNTIKPKGNLMSKELRNCPCCNGPAIYHEDLNHFYAECHHCQLRTENYRTKERAAEIWNTRHDDWVAVEDGLPEDDEHRKLLLLDAGEVVTGCYCKEGGFEWWAGSYCNLEEPDSQKTITYYKLITLPEGA